VGALTRLAGEAGVCEKASGALACIIKTSNAHRDACAAAGAISALVGALTRHAGEAGVCENASGALAYIVWTSPAHRRAAVAAGAVLRLAAAWSVHPSAKNNAHIALQKMGYSDTGVPIGLDPQGGGGNGGGYLLVRQELGIPGHKVGKLIGTRGANIKALRARNGCSVNVKQESREDPRATVIVSGSAENVARCGSEILKFLSER
jgi:hypothetical protein